MKSLNLKPLKLAAVVASTLVVAACGSDSDPIIREAPTPPPPPPPVNVTYEVTVTNLMHAQPLSPVAVVLHDDGALWQIGEAASNALEVLAEGGMAADLVGQEFVTVNTVGETPVGPGASQTLTISIEDKTDSMMSIATMLVNTNDAFTGLNGRSLTDLSVGDSWTSVSYVYDAGTEANTEADGTIPGPADSGEGYNAERNDVDFVAMHPGVVSQNDGLSTSVLTQAHKFDNPAMRITITRTE